jgi:hypothetical protein
MTQVVADKPAPKVAVPKNGTNPNFGMNMPLMSSASTPRCGSTPRGG